MKATRITKPLTEVSKESFEQAMNRYAAAEVREREINKMMDAEVNEIAEKYAAELQCVAMIKQVAFDEAQAYCVRHKKELFAKKRRIGTVFGIAGMRMGTPRLKTTKGSDWNTVLAALKEKLPAYVRTIEEPAKDMLLADRHNEKVAPLLLEIGVQVVQDELFYIEPRIAA